jgi:hypothetical protein
MGEHYDNAVAELEKVDYEFEGLLAKAKVKALKQNELQIYDKLEKKQMNKAATKIYLFGDRNAQKEAYDLDEINLDWKGKDLENKAYGEFWKDDIGVVKGSQSVKRSRQGSRGSVDAAMMLTTPERKRRAIRELYLPEIVNKNYVKRKEIDLSTLYEDPFFDLVKKKQPRRGFRTGKASMDQRV